MSTASKVAERKRLHPEMYCPYPKCLWHTNGGYCPRHNSPSRQWEIAKATWQKAIADKTAGRIDEPEWEKQKAAFETATAAMEKARAEGKKV